MNSQDDDGVKVMKNFVRIAAVFIMMLFIQSCSTNNLEMQAEEQVTVFRNYFAAHEYKKIYESCADELRKNIPEDDFVKEMGKIEKNLGTFVSSSRQNMEIQEFLIGGSRVKLIYLSKYSKATVIETFIFINIDGKLMLYNYYPSK